MALPQLHGEYECKLDAKGRLRVPSTLLRQLGGAGPFRFFVNRGFENCLVIYPEKVWEENLEKINTLNVYRTQERNFIRYFFRGVCDVSTDGADRILISKNLLQYAEIQREVILFAYLDRIEMWDRQAYLAWLSKQPEDFAGLAEQVLGNSPTDSVSNV